MAASLSLTRADVQTADERIERVSVLVRRNVATLRRGTEVVMEADVDSVQRVERRKWTVTLADGSQWAVVQAGRRCCGG